MPAHVGRKRRYRTALPDENQSWDKDEGDPDKLLAGYDSIIRESALLTTFSGFLFGFLLNISVLVSGRFSLANQITLLVSMMSITVAISLFVMPVIYHHMQYPYRNLEKFKKRAHKFMKSGFIPVGVTLYLSLEIALSNLINEFAFIVAVIPFGLVYLVFVKRK